MAYTYLIGWTNEDKWYYGARYANDCSKNDLWETYFTSSKHVKDFRKEHGDPDVIEVRKVFGNRNDAILWEEKVLKRMRVRESDRWLNRNDQCAPPIMKGSEHPLYGIGHSEKAKKKMSVNGKGKGKGIPKSEEHRKKISEARKKNWATNDKLKEKFAKKMKNNDYGKLHKGWIPSDETKQRMREKKKGVAQRLCCCLICQKEISISNIKQHYKANH